MNAFSYEAMKDDPKFKRFCARTVNSLIAKPKRFRVPIPGRKSIWSVMGPYTTGRMMKEGEIETLNLKKVTRDEFVSEEPWEGEIAAQSYEWPWGKIGDLDRGPGRWLKALFPAVCAGCKEQIEANQRGFYYKQTREILCENCGQRAAKARGI